MWNALFVENLYPAIGNLLEIRMPRSDFMLASCALQRGYDHRIGYLDCMRLQGMILSIALIAKASASP